MKQGAWRESVCASSPLNRYLPTGALRLNFAKPSCCLPPLTRDNLTARHATVPCLRFL
jgi:hypothetical protein